MPNILGPRSLLDNALPTGVDGNEVLRQELQGELTIGELIALATNEIGQANEWFASTYGGIMSLTERSWSRYSAGTGVARTTPRLSEFAGVDSQRGAKAGHMLPLWDYRDATAWSEQWLKRSITEDIVDDLSEIKNGWINRLKVDVWTRALTNTEEPIGSSGYSVGWAIGTGTNVNFIPQSRNGYDFTSSHTQYRTSNAALSASEAAAALEADAELLSHMGHTGRKIAFVSEADLATYTAMDAKKFVRIIPGEVTVVNGGSDAYARVTGELEGIPGELFGLYLSDYGTVELRYDERIPTGYYFMTKSYGNMVPQNGLAVRVESGRGFGMVVDPMMNTSINPRLEYVRFDATHGVGVMDRTNGIARMIASGASYSNPTIS